jgi:HK97 family phage portal protein
LRLVALTDDGVWVETANPAFSPVLRKPNRYQTIQQFLEAWLLSKLLTGNAYIVKARDDRPVVVALYVLDPARVTPLVAPDSAVYYELQADDLRGVVPELDRPNQPLVVAASEIIHDRWNCFFHPLVGQSPLYAGAGAAVQGLTIQANSTAFFANGSQPSGFLTAPGAISDETAARLAEKFNSFRGANAGRVAVGGDGLKYEVLRATAVDSQLTEQEKRITELICSVYHVPAAFIDASHAPPYANSEPLVQQYYSQCLQTLMTAIETCLDEGLGLLTPTSGGVQYGTEFDIDDLIWMDTATRTKSASEAIGGGGMSPNEARAKYYGLGPVKGGQSPYLQQQNYSLAALAERDADAPFAKPAPAPSPEPEPEPAPVLEEAD